LIPSFFAELSLTPVNLVLSNEELALLQPLAGPIAFDQRPVFLQAVAEAYSGQPHRGLGSLHRIAAQLQTGFVRSSIRVTPEESRAVIGLTRNARHQVDNKNVRGGRATWYR
jgi:hypothetical protein